MILKKVRYGKKTNRTHVCVLIMEDLKKKKKYLNRLHHTVYDKKQISNFKTFTVKKAVKQKAENN